MKFKPVSSWDVDNEDILKELIRYKDMNSYTEAASDDEDEYETWGEYLDEDEEEEDEWDGIHIDSDWWAEGNTEYDYERLLHTTLTEMERQGTADFLLIKDDELRSWWGRVKELDRKHKEAKERREAAICKQEEDKRAREELLARLTPDEKRLLGIK